MPVYQAQFTHPQRQVSVRVDAPFVEEHPAGAVHRLDAEGFLIDFNRIHIVFIMIPVARAVPKFLI